MKTEKNCCASRKHMCNSQLEQYASRNALLYFLAVFSAQQPDLVDMSFVSMALWRCRTILSCANTNVCVRAFGGHVSVSLYVLGSGC
eukprot:3321191-Pleurochrysis_carterae.AAC.3